MLTPLMLALKSNHLYIARLLLREGADVTLKDSFGDNLIHISVESKKVAVIFWAIENEQVAASGVGVNDQRDGGETPLMLSVRHGTIDIYTLLLTKGSDPSIGNNDGEGLINFAAYRGLKRSIDFVLAHGSNVNDVDNDGSTALMI